MAFESLSQKLQDVFRKLTSRGKLSESDVKEGMREVRMALLEADVSYKVVKDFIARVTERAVGTEILASLTPGQQVIKIVNEELIALMGASAARLTWSSAPPTVYMLVGLQGAGKTTAAGKLASHLKKTQGKKPLLVACDVYRPAAIDQLKIVAEKVGVPVFEMGQGDPVMIAAEGLAYAKRMLFDPVIVDTAGRLHIDEALMSEVENIKTAVKPQEILLAVDAMTGQDAVNVSETFNTRLNIDGVILTKLDGDARGGAALSVRAVTGKPIKFASVGEKLTDLEPFHPERMASRILGMGDMLSLIEKAQETFDEKQAADLEKKLKTQQFTLEDFLEQFQQMKKMGGLAEILKMLPGASKLGDVQIDDKQIAHVEAIIRSMTVQERRNPDVLNASRRKRIAAGSGRTVQEINQLIKQFEQSRQMMKQFMGGGKRRLRMPF